MLNIIRMPVLRKKKLDVHESEKENEGRAMTRYEQNVKSCCHGNTISFDLRMSKTVVKVM